jgi:hypothetical protein
MPSPCRRVKNVSEKQRNWITLWLAFDILECVRAMGQLGEIMQLGGPTIGFFGLVCKYNIMEVVTLDQCLLYVCFQ